MLNYRGERKTLSSQKKRRKNKHQEKTSTRELNGLLVLALRRSATRQHGLQRSRSAVSKQRKKYFIFEKLISTTLTVFYKKQRREGSESWATTKSLNSGWSGQDGTHNWKRHGLGAGFAPVGHSREHLSLHLCKDSHQNKQINKDHHTLLPSKTHRNLGQMRVRVTHDLWEKQKQARVVGI